MTLEWADPYGSPDSGVDHLGLRLAGETAYAKLIDFTTTVTWRPRYLSYLCWALRTGWDQHAEQDGDDYEVEYSAWRSTIKAIDFAYAASSVAADPDAERIIGNRHMRRLLSRNPTSISNGSDHVKGRGSVDVYAGAARSVGLTSGAQGVERPTELGEDLATAFASMLGVGGALLQQQGKLAVDKLAGLGKRAGVSSLASASTADAAVREERQLLRDVLFPISSTSDAIVSRLASVGIVLRLHGALAGEVDANDFRSAVLDHVVLRSGGPKSIPFPKVYGTALVHWRWYQVRAYAVHALEVLLASVVSTCRDVSGGLPFEEVLGRLVRDAASSPAGLPDELSGKLTGRLGALLDFFERRIGEERPELWMEPELAREMARKTSSAETSHQALLLFFMAVARMRVLEVQDGLGGWLGTQAAGRLPPSDLLEVVSRKVEAGASVAVASTEIVRDLVVRQHIANAHRKLEADPGRDTSRLVIEEGQLVAVGIFDRPGSSYPRYANTVSYLHDLGYVDAAGEVTSDGTALAEAIEAKLA